MLSIVSQAQYLDIICNSRDPNRIETHALDVIQLVDDTPISPAAPARVAAEYQEGFFISSAPVMVERGKLTSVSQPDKEQSHPPGYPT
jgi:hypothetical protein